MTETIKGFKGFDKDLKCRGYQYEVGQDFQEEGKIEACSKGFHFCENPFDVFSYYPPSSENGINRYCVVEGGGSIDKDSDDTKIACSKLHISAEIGLKGLVEAGVKFILDKVNWKDCKESNTGDRSAATNTGYQSAATNTRDRSAATNTGYQSAATNTGNYSAATNTGDYSAATNTGDQSAAEVSGKDSIAIVTGKDSKAKGSIGCWIVLTERGDWDGNTYPIKEVKAVKVDGGLIKPDTYYKLDNGEIIPCE
ncbi:hypothetical protein ACMSEA_20850 [Bacteroides thetaiotaomicron]|uniref:DUF7666 domain-containing protein n=1 Tax=Bacteroides thetaiotaomicron TaxID=818 RepID=UPI0039C49788